MAVTFMEILPDYFTVTNFLQIRIKFDNLSDFYCGMCRYEMLYGIERLSLLFVASFLLPLLCMTSVYMRLLIVIRRQVKSIYVHYRFKTKWNISQYNLSPALTFPVTYCAP